MVDPSRKSKASGDSGPSPDEPNLWALAGAGLELAAAVGAFAVLGWWLDGLFDTPPWLLITGAGLGLVGGMYNLWEQVKGYL